MYCLDALVGICSLGKGSTIELLPDTEIKCFVQMFTDNKNFTYKVSGKKFLYNVKYFIESQTVIKYQNIEYRVSEECEIELYNFTGKISQNNRRDTKLMIGYVNLFDKKSDYELVLLEKN